MPPGGPAEERHPAMTAHFSHRRRAAWLLAGLLPACVSFAPAPVQANDRDLRGTLVPASACVEILRSSELTGNPWIQGFFSVDGMGRFRCAALCRSTPSTSPAEPTTTTSPRSGCISKIRVHYRDQDGFGPLAGVEVALVRNGDFSNGQLEVTTVCTWRSNLDGTGSTNVVRAIKACPHSLAFEGFHHFDVSLSSNSAGRSAQFLGITFP